MSSPRTGRSRRARPSTPADAASSSSSPAGAARPATSWRAKELELDEDRGLKETLQQEGRWAELGKIAFEPVRKLQESFDLAKEVLSDLPRGMNPEGVIDGFRGEPAMLVFALQEAGRADDEAAVRAKAVELDPSEEMKQALDNGVEG